MAFVRAPLVPSGEPSPLTLQILVGLIMPPVFSHCCLKGLELWRFRGV